MMIALTVMAESCLVGRFWFKAALRCQKHNFQGTDQDDAKQAIYGEKLDVSKASKN